MDSEVEASTLASLTMGRSFLQLLLLGTAKYDSPDANAIVYLSWHTMYMSRPTKKLRLKKNE